jgi:hypothetical protein
MMDIIDLLQAAPRMAGQPDLEGELRAGLQLYWDRARRILDNSGGNLAAPGPEFFQLRHNFFSALFLLSFHRADIDPARRTAFAAVNQCLRGMVTGCDNILDDEYKKTLDTDLPGTRFRSIIDIMVSDRVLFDILLDLHEAQGVPLEAVRRAHAASLRALPFSGAEEASEEGGVFETLAPERILGEIHHLKTGLLFRCVWAVPLALDPALAPVAEPLADALYRIGMGCQVLDDMVDLAADRAMYRHNYLASLIVHRSADKEAARAGLDGADNVRALLERLPEARREASAQAMAFLGDGLRALLGPQGAPLIPAAVDFLVRRIGADDLLDPEARA